MKFVRYSLIAVAATAFSLAAYLTYQAETKPDQPISLLASKQKTLRCAGRHT
ncbi:peptidase M23, partial [Vibrio parahaemolyticus]|nr:peptidase M23 [Vibrio parahaemolyticus]